MTDSGDRPLNGLIQDVAGCSAFEEAGLCAVFEGEFKQILTVKASQHDDGDLRTMDIGHELDENFEPRHVGKVKLEDDAIDFLSAAKFDS